MIYKATVTETPPIKEGTIIKTPLNIESLENGLSHGSGINGKWYIDDMGKYYRCENVFETMSEYGYYDIDVYFQLIIPKNDPSEFKLHFKGKRSQYGASKYMLRDYLEDTFAYDIEELTK